jgi:hypothetical protein
MALRRYNRRLQIGREVDGTGILPSVDVVGACIEVLCFRVALIARSSSSGYGAHCLSNCSAILRLPERFSSCTAFSSYHEMESSCRVFDVDSRLVIDKTTRLRSIIVIVKSITINLSIKLGILLVAPNNTRNTP